jgi:hypothetical protein
VIIFLRTNICVCQALKRSILVLEANLEILDEVLKPLLDVELRENIVKLGFNLDDNSPIQKRAKINLDCE